MVKAGQTRGMARACPAHFIVKGFLNTVLHHWPNQLFRVSNFECKEHFHEKQKDVDMDSSHCIAALEPCAASVLYRRGRAWPNPYANIIKYAAKPDGSGTK